ncbi:TPA: hypothetical protein NQN63_001812 [Legionella pneumophila]|nr:hypothetical protein [Legionella pneumophila]HCJ1114407.1 hypothetical protein [Legionella pneumophila]
MAKNNKRPLLATVASDARWLLGLRCDIRELINQISQPSTTQCISKTLHNPILDQLHTFLGGKQ